MNEKQSWNITVIFLLLVFGLTGATLVHREKTFSQRENRSLQTRPEVTLSRVLDGSFESDYERYLTDQFVGRDGWIALKTTTERASGKQEAHDVYFAKDNYLIEKHVGTFTAAQAEHNIALLGEFARKISSQFDAQHFTVMVVPNAVKMLEDKLPAFAAPYDEEVYLRKVKSALPNGVWLDMETVLAPHLDEQLYYRTDHHWKTQAAFYAWQEVAQKMGFGEIHTEDYMINRVTDSFEGTVAAKVGIKVKSDSIEVFEPKDAAEYLLTYNQSDDVRSSVYQEYALEGRDKYAYFYGGNYALIEGGTKAKSDRRVLVIKDSYAHAFVPFLYDYAEKVDMVDLRYYNESLAALMEKNAYTDVIVLYNASGFAEDASLAKLLA